MSGGDKRLDRLFPVLGARERAILVLRALKEDRQEDPEVRLTMPTEQAQEFNRYMALLNAVNTDIGFYITLLRQLVEQLNLRYCWLLTIHVWSLLASSVAAYLVLCTKEPVTESEYQQHLKDAREEMLSVSELAEGLIERYEAWAEADLEEFEGEQVVTDAAWKRVLREKKQEIIGLVDSGVLVGKRSGKRVRVNAGSFYDWLGEPVPLLVEWGLDYEVFPDSQAEEVESLQRARKQVRATLRHMPSKATFDPSLRRVKKKAAAKGERSWDDIGHALQTKLREGIDMRWGELRAIELALEKANEEFDGEDVLHPDSRQVLDETKRKLQELRDGLEAFGEPLELSEPDEERLHQVEDLLRRARKSYWAMGSFARDSDAH